MTQKLISYVYSRGLKNIKNIIIIIFKIPFAVWYLYFLMPRVILNVILTDITVLICNLNLQCKLKILQKNL